MNTHGHEDVAKTAGIPLLEETFGKDKRSPKALYLGNWLTDVSQAVDPVAYWSASKKTKGGIDTGGEALKNAAEKFVEELVSSVFDYDHTVGPRVLKALKPVLDDRAKSAKEALHGLIDFFIAAQTNERDARVAQFFHDCFLVKGYFKFVHPDSPKQPARMDFEGFMRVFGRPGDTRGAAASPATDRPGAYTQYYPHEHLDRPEMLPSQDPAIFAPGKQSPFVPFRVASGKKSGIRSPRSKPERIDPDLYSYLRDHIEMTAGLLAEADDLFQRAFAQGFRDDDPTWYITLAKLGHALHQVEDFFAHSNWVELATKRLGKEFFKKVIPPETRVEMIDRAYTTYHKRLKRHLTVSRADWRQHDDEDWVVTGFFDFNDTAISLAHLSEELFGLDVSDPYLKGYQLGQEAKAAIENPKTIEYEVGKLMRQTLDFLRDPKRALEDDDNKISQSLKDKFQPDINKMRRPGVSQAVAEQVARESKYLSAAPKEIQDAFFNVIVEGSRVYHYGKSAFTIYGAVREIGQFMGDPLGWLAQWLPKQIKKRFIDAFKFYARERFYDWIGASRIGCHSLMAKDHGREPFYEQQKACATAVHWYIVKTLLRWKDNPKAGYIDWLELLEYFLRNPLPPPGYGETEIIASVTVVHITKTDDQIESRDKRHSLVDLYRPSALNRSRFDWRAIADANYNTTGLSKKEAFDTINRILRESGTGYPVTPPNYAYKKGVRVLIPQQRIKLTVCTPLSGEKLWFKDVFDKGWEVFRGRDDPETGTSQPPLEHHKPIVIQVGDMGKISTRGKKLRREAREAYRPQNYRS